MPIGLNYIRVNILVLTLKVIMKMVLIVLFNSFYSSFEIKGWLACLRIILVYMDQKSGLIDKLLLIDKIRNEQ